MTLTVVIPCGVHDAAIAAAVDRVRAVDVGPLRRDVLIVDRAPATEAPDAAPTFESHDDVRVLRLAGLGRGAALARGLAEATGDVVFVHDAEAGHDPADIPRLLAPVVDGRADVAIGSRVAGSALGRRVGGFWRARAHWGLTRLTSALTDQRLTDATSSALVLARDVVRRLDLRSTGDGIETEIIVKAARLRARLFEVPIGRDDRAFAVRARGAGGALAAAYAGLRYARWDAPAGDVGALTLRRMAALGAYNRWLHERFDSFLGQRVLEIGSGVGNQTRYFANRARVVASEPEPHYVRELQRRFEGQTQVRVASFHFPLTADGRDDLRQEQLDTVVCMNVLEHIDDDRQTLRDVASVLPAGGHLVLLVPAMPALYGSLDRALGHFRRYDRQALMTLVTDAGFGVHEARYLNRPGVAGWWLNARVLRRRVLPGLQTRLFTWLMPLLRREAHQQPRFGLSLLVLATRR